MKCKRGDILFTSEGPKGRIKGEMQVEVVACSDKKNICLVKRVDPEDFPLIEVESWFVELTHLSKKSRWAEQEEKANMVFVVELRVEDAANEDGVAYIGSTLKHAQHWIKKHGEEWAGYTEPCPTAYYTIVGQKINGDPMDIETFGQFKLTGEEGRTKPDYVK
jgi:hypothetical protein